MQTELYCKSLDKLDKVDAIRAIQFAWLQLGAMGERVELEGITLDNTRAMAALWGCLEAAGHIATWEENFVTKESTL